MRPAQQGLPFILSRLKDWGDPLCYGCPEIKSCSVVFVLRDSDPDKLGLRRSV